MVRDLPNSWTICLQEQCTEEFKKFSKGNLIKSFQEYWWNIVRASSSFAFCLTDNRCNFTRREFGATFVAYRGRVNSFLEPSDEVAIFGGYRWIIYSFMMVDKDVSFRFDLLAFNFIGRINLQCTTETVTNFPHVSPTGYCHGSFEHSLPGLFFGLLVNFNVTLWSIVCSYLGSYVRCHPWLGFSTRFCFLCVRARY